jgi:hypothetical protein
MKFHENLYGVTHAPPCRKTDMTRLIIGFYRHFANVPKNGNVRCNIYDLCVFGIRGSLCVWFMSHWFFSSTLTNTYKCSSVISMFLNDLVS